MDVAFCPINDPRRTTRPVVRRVYQPFVRTVDNRELCQAGSQDYVISYTRGLIFCAYHRHHHHHQHHHHHHRHYQVFVIFE